MAENEPPPPDAGLRPKVSLSKREQIMRNADKILADMNLRKDVVGSLLTHKELQPNWAKVRQNSLHFSKSGQMLANPVVSKLFEEAEPLLNQFQDDISAVKIKICLLMADFDKEDMMSQSLPDQTSTSPAGQFILILKVVQNMSTWATNTQENWVSYHITREQMGDPSLNGHEKAQEELDRGRAIAAWDCKMSGEMRTTLNTLLYNYVALEDIVYRAKYAFGTTGNHSLWKIYS